MFYGGEILNGMYQIIREIGKGGTGVIYLAWHMHLQKEIVIKKLRDDIPDVLDVRSEADILKSLHHTGLPQVYDFLQIGPEIYTVMEYIRGKDLQYYIDHGYRFEERQLVCWLQQLCQVLEYLHGNQPQILHSDIKPGNIMVTPEGNVCLIDFNISLDASQNAGLKGISRYYAAPEQYDKAELIWKHQDASEICLDGRMDLYSLGATFYCLMTGMVPENVPNRQYPIEQLDIPYSDGLKAIIAKSMEWDAGKRYATAGAMAKALETVYRSDRQYRALGKIRMLCRVVCAVLLLLGVWGVYYGYGIREQNAYDRTYEEFLEVCGQYNNDEIVNSALNILNDRRYQKFLSEKREDKAQILGQMGDAYFEQELYGLACDYYLKAAEIVPDNIVYCQNSAIAAARSGDIRKAERIIGNAEKKGSQDAGLLLASQEIACMKQDYSRVIAQGEQLETLDPDRDTAAKSNLLTAKAYMELGDTVMEMEYLRQAGKAGGGVRCQRELGRVCLEQAQKESSQTLAEQYLTQSETCYRSLWESGYKEPEDGLHLAIVLELKENYKESMEILTELDRRNVQMYQVYMHMAYISCIQQDKTGMGNYREAQNYYDKAQKLYQQSGTEDQSMEDIRVLLENRLSGRWTDEEEE